ncbi:MAG: glycosyltransferase family 2 protein [Saprospiraceae bacterium]
MKNAPLVSIIIPCYNYGRYVAQTLDSVLAQTYQNWECLVVDDGSKDNSGEVVKAYEQKDQRITYIYQNNKGLPGARNTGIKAAKGKYFMVLDADDTIQHKKIEAQVTAFENDPSLDFTYAGVRYFIDGKPEELRYSADWRNRPWALEKSGKGMDLLKYMIISDVILSHQPMIKTETVFEIGLYKEHLKSCEDWEFYLRCMYNDLNIKYVDQPDTLALIRVHPSSMTRNRTVMINHMILVRNMLNEKLSNSKLIALNNKFLINDLIELSIVKRQFEGVSEGEASLQESGKKYSSLRITLFKITTKLLSPQRNLFFLSILRTLMKKTYYRKSL